MQTIETVDVEGVIKEWAATYPGLTGPTGAISAGLHLTTPRSPASGAIGQIRVTSRTPTDLWDTARINVRIKASGGTGGAVAQASRAGRALVEALSELSGQPTLVQTALGDWIRIVTVADISGPAPVGEGTGGEVTYAVDATICCQPTTAPYGAGPYGVGTYGG